MEWHYALPKSSHSSKKSQYQIGRDGMSLRTRWEFKLVEMKSVSKTNGMALRTSWEYKLVKIGIELAADGILLRTR